MEFVSTVKNENSEVKVVAGLESDEDFSLYFQDNHGCSQTE